MRRSVAGGAILAAALFAAACGSPAEQGEFSGPAAVSADSVSVPPASSAPTASTAQPTIGGAALGGLPSVSECDADGNCEQVAVETDVPDDVWAAAMAQQQAYLEDEVLTEGEYEAAFTAFVNCANEGGGTVERRGVDPVSGLISYVIYDEGYEVADQCYWMHFDLVDGWFQRTNPAVRERDARTARDNWTNSVVPCLERFGVDVPDHLDGNDDSGELGPFYRRYVELLQAGSCE